MLLDINELEQALAKSLSDFQEEADSLHQTIRGKHPTSEDFLALAKLNFYTFTDFKNHIITYLKDHS